MAGELLRHLGFAESDYMLGRTLAFLRSGALGRCEAARARQLGRVFSLVQSRFRAKAAALHFTRQRTAARRLQRGWRRKVAVVEARRLLRIRKVERAERWRQVMIPLSLSLSHGTLHRRASHGTFHLPRFPWHVSPPARQEAEVRRTREEMFARDEAMKKVEAERQVMIPPRPPPLSLTARAQTYVQACTT